MFYQAHITANIQSFQTVGVESCEIVLLGDTSYSRFRNLPQDVLFGHNAKHHSQMDGQTDDSITPIADQLKLATVSVYTSTLQVDQWSKSAAAWHGSTFIK